MDSSVPKGMTAFTAAVYSPVWTSGDDLICATQYTLCHA